MNKIDLALTHLRTGRPIIVVDRQDRENEGDIVIAGEKANHSNVVFAMRYARGLMCLPCTGKILDRLEIPMMVKTSTDKLQTPFTVSVDAIHGISTGMSASDRLRTIGVFNDGYSIPSDLARPGHLFPLRAKDGLLQDRQGHTEASVELMRMGGFKEFAVIAEIINDDGTMAKGQSLKEFEAIHNLITISVDEIESQIYG